MIIIFCIIIIIIVVFFGIYIIFYFNAKWYTWILFLIFIIEFMNQTISHTESLRDSHCRMQPEYKIDLYSGSNSNKLEGKFYLMGGYINDVDMVYYWVKNGDALNKYRAPMSMSTFIEDGKNYMQIYSEECSPGWLYFAAKEYKTFTFHVPQGSVDNMYQFK